MQNEGKTVLNLSILPSDVVRKIIKVGLDSIDSLKLISSRWNALAIEVLNDRKRLPAIKCITIRYDTPMAVSVEERFRKYFGVEKWRIVQEDSNFKTAQWFHTTFTDKEMGVLYRILRRCSRIRRLDFDVEMLRKLEKANIVNLYLNEFTVQELCFSGILDANQTSRILRIVRQHRVPILVLGRSNCYVTKLYKFVLEALRLVPSIRFESSIGPESRLDQQHYTSWQEFTDKLNSAARVKAVLSTITNAAGVFPKSIIITTVD
ncbi:hypothetical protein PRIPAC_90390 [Pristionchus pacificus]|uniref:Uncharacterized protein n=1 Tax=Pristionchus pacificus TaxID=54126 RepID=A0A2A6B7D5_PRIPA|nr:hypothetical protein PRIPAC_90390 [Pristionchus pacificus]|eukprot:PDM61790.1 hypothetical protein PRIPAC_51232 [Pristionchus pacificus]